MNGAALARRRLAPQDALLGVASALAAFGLALVLAVTLARQPLPLGLVVLAFGAALLGTLALALARYDAAVGLGVFLLGVGRVEPAPADLILVRRDRGRVRDRALLHPPRPADRGRRLIASSCRLNMLASVELIDVGRAAAFFAITLYLVIFALWLTGYVRLAETARIVLRAYIAAAVFSAADARCWRSSWRSPAHQSCSSSARARRVSSRTRTCSGRSSSRRP